MDHNRAAPCSRRRRLFLVIGAVVALASVSGRVAQAATVEITATNLAFVPASATVQLTGGEPGFDAPHAHVVWTMAEADAGIQHTVHIDNPIQDPRIVSSERLTAGQRHEAILYVAGTYTYRCTIHPSMAGTVVVVPGPPVTSAAPVRSPDAQDPASGDGSGSGARLVIGIAMVAAVAVLLWFGIRRRRSDRPGPTSTPPDPPRRGDR